VAAAIPAENAAISPSNRSGQPASGWAADGRLRTIQQLIARNLDPDDRPKPAPYFKSALAKLDEAINAKTQADQAVFLALRAAREQAITSEQQREIDLRRERLNRYSTQKVQSQ
jgi:hypothetical protein